MDTVTVVAIALLLAGVLATAVPLVPGGLLSLVGVVGHWWQTGEPAGPLLWVLVALPALALATDILGGVLAARAAGTSWTTAGLATGVGLVALVVTGPLGFLAAFLGTVLAVEVLLHRRPARTGARRALVTLVGVLASAATQLALTGLALVLFVVAVVP